jgi:serine/threonine protein phosphatase PrpC
MGCGSSSQSTGEKGSSNNISYSQIINEKCPHIKMDFPSGTKSFPIKGTNYNYELGYVYVSQRGFYPNALGKANQDSYVVCENFSNPNCHLFGVFDGHGEFGDYCSHFAADQVPLHLERGFNANTFDGAEMERKYTEAFVAANQSMHKAMFDDSLSGTTGVTAFVKGDTLHVANVGDSRAIIARRGDDGKLKSYPLSVDQTPFRKDERERLKKKASLHVVVCLCCCRYATHNCMQ